MKVKCTVKLNPANIEKINKAKEQAILLTLEALKSDVDAEQVVPMRDGYLVESTNTWVEGDKGYIGWDTAYARRQYFGIKKDGTSFEYRTDKHANATNNWMDLWIRGTRREWLFETYLTFLIQNSGGVIKKK